MSSAVCLLAAHVMGALKTSSSHLTYSGTSSLLNAMEWTEERPWGRFKNLLDLDFTKVKIIEVDPKKRLSYQSHSKRRESWTVAKGEALVVLNDREIRLQVGDHIDIPLGAKHRLENPGSAVLSIIEVQTGTYFGEDDIVRYQDDFGRGQR